MQKLKFRDFSKMWLKDVFRIANVKYVEQVLPMEVVELMGLPVAPLAVNG